MAAPTAAAAIAIPSDVHPFAANLSPRGVDLEGRLDLSLGALTRKILCHVAFLLTGLTVLTPTDALIKERKKEHKLLKKQEEANKLKKQKPQTADKRKTPKQQHNQKQKPQPTVKSGQKAQRKALVNKNRGLSAPPPAGKDKSKTKTSIAATTAKLRRQMRADKAKGSAGRQVASPKVGNQSNTLQQKKKNAPQQARKVTSPTQPKNGKKLQAQKQQPQTQAKAFVSGRQVVRAGNKKAKLSITITGKTGKKSEKKQKANKVVLPGKFSQAFSKKASAAKKVVKRVKNRKASAATTTQVVRKMPGQRKKN
jgi:hypothetical protein